MKIKYFKKSLISQPKMRYRYVVPIFPPPGLNLEIPNWTPTEYLNRIGNNCIEQADKFETIQEIFESSSKVLKEKGVPADERRHILRMKEQLRRGVLTFEYLERRLKLSPIQRKA